jgi:hypothetical protein
MTTPHPGDSWPRFCPRSYSEPVLLVDARRNIHAAWPPGAVCEECGAPNVNGGGYVGPVAGDPVTYPAPSTRFTRRICAQDTLGLDDSEWSGHSRRPECTDNTHVDWVALGRDDLLDAPPSERVSRFAEDYAGRGWTVSGVEIETAAPFGSGRFWAITFQPTRPRW